MQHSAAILGPAHVRGIHTSPLLLADAGSGAGTTRTVFAKVGESDFDEVTVDAKLSVARLKEAIAKKLELKDVPLRAITLHLEKADAPALDGSATVMEVLPAQGKVRLVVKVAPTAIVTTGTGTTGEFGGGSGSVHARGVLHSSSVGVIVSAALHRRILFACCSVSHRCPNDAPVPCSFNAALLLSLQG
jgi:hypothetical protein